MKNMNSDFLVKKDELEEIRYKDILGFLHKDHRFVLPLVHFAQSSGALPKPCKLVLFDAHHDFLCPSKDATEKIEKMVKSALQWDAFLKFCDEVLSSNDNDWIKAGMMLGLFSDAVVFGVDKMPTKPEGTFTDSGGIKHRFVIKGCLPTKFMLDWHSDLDDLARAKELSTFWDLFGWEHVDGQGFRFKDSLEKIFISIDLDVFAINAADCTFAWPNEVFEEHFHSASTGNFTNNWTGRILFDELIKQTGLLAIAKEPTYCGGKAKAKTIFERLNHFLFDDKLVKAKTGRILLRP
jgi:hypothetical protein